MSFFNSTLNERCVYRPLSGLEEHKQFVEVSAATVMSGQSVFDFCCDKVTANPAVAHGSHGYLKEMLHFS